MSKKYIFVFIVVLGFFIMSFIYIQSKKIEEELALEEEVLEEEDQEVVEEPGVIKKKISGEIIRKVRIDPNRQFFNNWIFAGDQEIATYKNNEEKIFDFVGAIPDGKVKFINETNNTYGEEYYWNNQRQGTFKEYYKEGQLKREATYESGRLLTNKAYFIDGILSLEEDYNDALVTSKTKESGRGKSYSRKGALIYEWSLTNAQKGGYTKAYSATGEWRETRNFDEYGNMTSTSKWEAPKVQEEALP